MRKWCCLLLCLLLPWCVQAEDVFGEVRAELALRGFEVDDTQFQAIVESYNQYVEQMAELMEAYDLYAEPFGGALDSKADFAYHALMHLGMGTYDEAWNWTPSTYPIYVFDAEFFDIESMYTDFLRGVGAIVQEVAFDQVTEDLSNLDENLEGKRSVSFTCNGTAYAVELDSYGDWINDEIIDFVNRVLAENEATGQLHVISDVFDQCIFLVYGSAYEADEMRRLIGTTTSTDDFVNETDWFAWDELLDIGFSF